MIILDESSKRIKQPKLGWQLFPHQLAMLYQMIRIEKRRFLPTGISYFPELPKEQVVYTEHGTIPSRSGLGSTVLILALSQLSDTTRSPITIVYNPCGSGLPPKCLPRVVLPAIENRYQDGDAAMDLIITTRTRVSQWRSDLAALGIDPESTLWITDDSPDGELMEHGSTLLLCASRQVRRVIIISECADQLESAITGMFWDRFVGDLIEVCRFRIKCNFAWSIVSPSNFLQEEHVAAWSYRSDQLNASRSMRTTNEFWVPFMDCAPVCHSTNALTSVWDPSFDRGKLTPFAYAKTLSETLHSCEITNSEMADRIQEQLDDECIICAEFLGHPVLTICCKQVMCVTCAAKCMTTDETCPMCRSPLLHLSQLCAILPNQRAIAGVRSRDDVVFEHMKAEDVIICLLQRIVSQVFEPRVMVVMNDRSAISGLLEYLDHNPSARARQLSDDYYPSIEISDWARPIGLDDEDLSLSDIRLMIVTDSSAKIPKCPWITHIILADEEMAEEKRFQRAVLCPIPIDDELAPVVRFCLFEPNRSEPHGLVIPDFAALRETICNPIIAAMDQSLSEEESCSEEESSD